MPPVIATGTAENCFILNWSVSCGLACPVQRGTFESCPIYFATSEMAEAFAGGSLGFLTPFPISDWLKVLKPVLGSKCEARASWTCEIKIN